MMTPVNLDHVPVVSTTSHSHRRQPQHNPYVQHLSHHSRTVAYLLSCFDLTCVYVDPQIQQFSIEPHEVLQHYDWRQRFVHPDDRERLKAHQERCFLQPGIHDIRYRLWPKNTHPIWVHEETQIIVDTEQRPLFLSGVVLNAEEETSLDFTMPPLLQSLGAAAHRDEPILTAVAVESPDKLERTKQALRLAYNL